MRTEWFLLLLKLNTLHCLRMTKLNVADRLDLAHLSPQFIMYLTFAYSQKCYFIFSAGGFHQTEMS